MVSFAVEEPELEFVPQRPERTRIDPWR